MEEVKNNPPLHTGERKNNAEKTTSAFRVKSGVLVALASLSLLGAMATLYVVSRGTPYALAIKYI